MVNTQTLDFISCQKVQRGVMGLFKHLRVFHAQTRQFVDIKKTTVVDIVRRHTPVSQSVRLALKKKMQPTGVFRCVGLRAVVMVEIGRASCREGVEWSVGEGVRQRREREG